MSDATKAIITTAISAGVALSIAILSVLAAYFARKRERQRVLYSEAVRAAVTWNEMLYRVRRRRSGQELELISKFHDLQSDLSYYSAWVGSDSRTMKVSYDDFVSRVKGATEPLISAAWRERVRPVPGNARAEDTHPDIPVLTDKFLKDVRSHLSPLPWRKLAVWLRNRARKQS